MPDFDPDLVACRRHLLAAVMKIRMENTARRVNRSHADSFGEIRNDDPLLLPSEIPHLFDE